MHHAGHAYVAMPFGMEAQQASRTRLGSMCCRDTQATRLASIVLDLKHCSLGERHVPARVEIIEGLILLKLG